MFERFAQEKNHYQKGQVFPFLIAILCVVLVLIMITINLGQIGVFRTDTSIAADAGALAGVSVLSGTLLGLGLRSESMYGDFIVSVGLALLCILGALETLGISVIAGIAILIVFIIGYYVDFFKAMMDCAMGWGNAKKTAMQYAFQNAGIDEPRPTFKEFVLGVYGVSVDSLSPENLKKYYGYYTSGDDPDASTERREKIRKYSQSGFASFMSDSSSNGFWEWDIPAPGKQAPVSVKSGYGWAQSSSGGNSYTTGGSYNQYDNWVDVEVIGSTTYLLSPYNILLKFINRITAYLEAIIKLPWWLEWLDNAVMLLVTWPLQQLAKAIPSGIMMPSFGGEAHGEIQQVDKNPLIVIVRRGKKELNAGLWKFRYGPRVVSNGVTSGVVESKAFAHAFGELDDQKAYIRTIEPTSDLLAGLLLDIANWMKTGSWDWDLLNVDTRRHLFETELMSAQ